VFVLTERPPPAFVFGCLYRPTFWRIYKARDVEEFKPDPYLATLLNCALWVFYGIPVVHPNSILVVTINGIGLVIEGIYLTIFFIYADAKKRVSATALLFWFPPAAAPPSDLVVGGFELDPFLLCRRRRSQSCSWRFCSWSPWCSA
jgi:hypothetical protein